MCVGPTYKDTDISSECINDVPSLAVGDHLAVKGKYLGAKYFHHGILTSKEPLEVVDFSGRNKSDAKVRKVGLKSFMNGERYLFRVNHKYRLSGEETVEKAIAYVKKDRWAEYNLLSNNCEHFAAYCVTGIKSSEQVSKLINTSLLRLVKDVKLPVFSW